MGLRFNGFITLNFEPIIFFLKNGIYQRNILYQSV